MSLDVLDVLTYMKTLLKFFRWIRLFMKCPECENFAMASIPTETRVRIVKVGWSMEDENARFFEQNEYHGARKAFTSLTTNSKTVVESTR
eukprot:TRINITY_DN15084_c0_g1_i1.p2 TRINITY_DN15084_c0_g1~~TRINITY_DN15084_c0_g1_i1.p2  ORF type:complete len:90 (-),score=12.05 TRINITY_DN15084_c0_g1_i1:66-335(-)